MSLCHLSHLLVEEEVEEAVEDIDGDVSAHLVRFRWVGEICGLEEGGQGLLKLIN